MQFCCALVVMQRLYLISEDACSSWTSHGKYQRNFSLCIFFFYFNRRQVFFNTELFELGWEAGVSESRAQHAFPHELLGLWVQDNPEKLC